MALPARWKRPPVQAVAAPAWQAAQSPVAAAWSKVSPAARAAAAEVSVPAGRVLAWQSRQEAGWGRPRP